MTPFFTATKWQIRSVHALLRREMLTRFGKRKLGYLWAIIEVLFHVAMFAAIKLFLGFQDVDGIPIVLFLLSGIIPFFYFRNVVNMTISALTANKGLLTFPQVTFMDIYYSRFILETLSSLFTYLVAIILTDLFVVDVVIKNPLGVVASFILIGALGFGIGLIFAALVPLADSLRLLETLLLRVLYFTSGVLFSVRMIPEQYHPIIYFNPMVHLMEVLRDNFFYSYQETPKFTDVNYVLLVAGGAILTGMLLVVRTKKWILR